MDSFSVVVLILIIGIVFVIYLLKTSYSISKKTPEIAQNEPPSSIDDQSKLLQVEEFLTLINDARKDYFRHSYKEELKSRYEPLFQQVSRISDRKFSTNPQVIQFKQVYSNLDSNVPTWNEAYCERELIENKDLFDCIDRKSLDEQQRRAVVVDEDNNLVLAGAGTGKTFTISAKVKYLVDRKNVNPDEILVISFTDKSTKEILKRISKQLKIGVVAKTFHKLGLNIIGQGRGSRPVVCENSELSKIVGDYFQNAIEKNPKVMQDLIEFFGYYLNIPEDVGKYNRQSAINEDSRDLDFETLKSMVDREANSQKSSKRTIQGEYVRSLEEVTIANFLYLHGVKYIYEMEYRYPTGDSSHKKYTPDFYLVDYDIYLEHFGINEYDRVPWLSPDKERQYVDGIRWKRTLHDKNKTHLIETYSYQNKNGELQDALDSLLKSNEVVYKQVDIKDVYHKVLSNKKDEYLKEFYKLISTFIKLFKSRGYSESDFDLLKTIALKEKNQFLKKRTLLFISIVKPIYLQYENYLKQSGKIDFEDMINQAADLINQGQVPINYRYIIVDEYQDISDGRFRLIKAIKQKTNAKVMAVGDDWQSIYRFAGSDINLFTNFAKQLGFTETLKIERKYRNSQELLDIAGHFVTKNPIQLQKKLVSDLHNISPIKIVRYKHDPLTAIKYAIEQISNLVEGDGKILLLGRTNYDVKVFTPDDGNISTPSNTNHEFKINSNGADVTVEFDPYPGLSISFLTVHKVKGLEEENVIVLNMANSLLGFPNKMSDDPVLSLVLTEPDEYHYAEERRLFYVALTRTKNNVYLITPDQNPSVFVEELLKDHDISQVLIADNGNNRNKPICPRCKIGYLKVKTNSYDGSKFLGCSRWDECEYTQNIDDVNDDEDDDWKDIPF